MQELGGVHVSRGGGGSEDKDPGAEKGTDIWGSWLSGPRTLYV